MTARLVLACAGAALLLSGCEHPENYRWAEGSNPDFSVMPEEPQQTSFDWGPGPSVNVYTYATAQTPAAPLSVTGLSDRAQAAWIEALAKANFDADKVGGILGKPLGQKDSSSEGAAAVDESFGRTLVVTVSEGLDAGPADRLAWSWVDIRPRNFVFDGYSIAATDNEQLNIENVTNQTTASLQGQAGLTTSNTNAVTNSVAPPQSTGGPGMSDVLTKVLGTSAGATGNLSNVYTTSAAINQQYPKLHVDIKPDELRIFRGSERNLDVTGNTLVALTMRVDPDIWDTAEVAETIVQRVSKLTLTANGKMQPPKKVDIGVTIEKAPPACPLIAGVTLIYELRKVGDARSYVEGEQKAQYIRAKRDFGDVTLVRAGEVRKPSWRVRAQNDKDNFVFLSDAFDSRLPLDFSTYEQARNFAQWLNQRGAWLHKPVKHGIGTNGAWLSWAGLDSSYGFPRATFIADRYSEKKTKAECATMNVKSIPMAAGAPDR